MRISSAGASILVCLSLLASGCAGGAPDAGTASESAAPTPAAPATVTAETGGINGVVVDDEELPIPGAEIAILASNRSTETDASGRFSFSELAPGSVDLVAQKLGYDTAGRKIDVLPGEVAEVTLTLVALAIVEAYVEPLIFDGYIRIGTALLAAAEGDSGVRGYACEKCFFQWNASADVVSVVFEVLYTQNLPVPPDMLLYTQTYGGGRVGGPLYYNEEWGSGTKRQLDKEAAKWPAKGEGFYQMLACGLFSVCYDQRFTEYVTQFHGLPPAEDFTAIPK